MRSIGQIRELASQVLEDAGYSHTFPVPIDKIINDYGFAFKGINKENAPKDFSGLVNHEQKLVVINNSHSDGRKRFTAAHEFGHIILHPNENEVDYRIAFASPDPKETEANYFAAEILMPYEAFNQIYHECHGDLAYMADYFGVSVAAVTIRAEFLHLI